MHLIGHSTTRDYDTPLSLSSSIMAMYSFQCPHCGGMFQVLSEMSGQAVACPHCRGAVMIQELAPPIPPVQAAPSMTTPPGPTAPPVRSVAPDPWTPPQVASARPSMPLESPNPPASSYAEPPKPAGEHSKATDAEPAIANEPPAQPPIGLPASDVSQTTHANGDAFVTAVGELGEFRHFASREKSARRTTKNLIIVAICVVALSGLLWWLLQRGPL